MKSLVMAGWLLTALFCGAITPEVVKIYRPVSYVETVSYTEIGDEAYQAGVVSFPTVISGAVPEDLISAIQKPARFNAISDIYEVSEVNLITLCGLELEIIIESQRELRVIISAAQMTLPAEVEIGARTLIALTKQAIKQTLTAYFEDGGTYQEVHLSLTGLREDQLSLEDLQETFTVGVLEPKEQMQKEEQ